MLPAYAGAHGTQVSHPLSVTAARTRRPQPSAPSPQKAKIVTVAA